MSGINPSATNTTPYPLMGGVKPTSPTFPAEMNPEVLRLSEENTKLANIVQEQAAEILKLQAIADERASVNQKQYELLLALVGKLPKNNI